MSVFSVDGNKKKEKKRKRKQCYEGNMIKQDEPRS